MLKRVAIFVTWMLCAGMIAGQSDQASSGKQAPTQQNPPTVVSSDGQSKQPSGQANQVDPSQNASSQSTTFKWPTWIGDSNWWLVIVAICTAGVICWQSIATQKSVRGALVAADAALLNAQAFINAERPWILVKVEPSKRRKDEYEVIAVNKGRTPAALISHAENCILIGHMELPPDIAEYKESEFQEPLQIILPDEFVLLHVISKYSIVGKDERKIARFENFLNEDGLEGYVFGTITYRDLLGPPNSEPHETRWSFHVHPLNDGELLVFEYSAGGDEYTRHT